MIEKSEQMNCKLAEYQALLKHPLIKTAAESVNSDRFFEICKKIEMNEIQLLEGINESLIPLLKDYPNLDNSSFKALLPLVVALDELFTKIHSFADRCFSGKVYYDIETQALIEKAKQNFCAEKDKYEMAIGRSLGKGFLPVLKEIAYCQAKEKESIIEKLNVGIADFLKNSDFGVPSEYICKEANQVSDLPESICIGKIKDSKPITRDEIMNSNIEDLFLEIRHQNVSITPRESGNIIINAPQGSERDDALYDFISNIVLRYYDSFPIGTLKVHFVDSLMSPKFSKFVSGFQSGNKNEKTRAAVELVPEYDGVSKQLEIKCDDLMKSKLVGATRDFYDLFKIDNYEHFDLVIVRNGFSDLARDGRKNVLQSLVNHFDHDSRGHRCGIRFIIVNDVDYGDYRIDDETKKNIDHILSDAEIVLDYKSGNFQSKNKTISPLSIEPGYEEESFIETKCSKIAEILSKSANKAITYQELGCFDAPSCPASAVISIPVGKSGNEIVSIPFSCADIDNSDAAKNIGLMVLGESGSGKSSLYHSIIINGSMKYSPDDLQFWLLDFKNNSSAGIYSDIPHIKIVAPNSKKNDAYSILRILVNELEYRLDLFNQIGQEMGVKLSNVFEYNQFVEKEGLKEYPRLPRIILMIDEVQELFRDNDGFSDDLPKQIGNYINKLVSLGRSSGVHMAMFAQNLDSQKTYILKDNFINQLKCKACFRLEPASVSNTGFHGAFDERKDEIPSLGTGEIYLSFSNTEIQKCRVAYESDEKLIQHLGKIVEKYPSFHPNALKIGLTNRLSALDRIPNTNQKYIDRVIAAQTRNEKIICTIGEDAYSLQPINIIFDPTKISSAFLVGNSREIAMSVFASLLMGFNSIGCDLRICNGSKQRENSLYNALLNSGKIQATKYNLFNIDQCVGEVYVEYKKRKESEEQTGDCERRPIVLFLNDFDAQDKVKQNVEIRLNGQAWEKPTEFHSLADILASANQEQTAKPTNDYLKGIRLKDAIEELLKDAYQYSIYLVVLLKETWYREFDESLKASGNVIIYNDSDYSSVVNGYFVKDLLKDIRQRKPARSVNATDDEDEEETDNESFAILSRNKDYLKFRPVMYCTQNKNEVTKILEILEDKKDG